MWSWDAQPPVVLLKIPPEVPLDSGTNFPSSSSSVALTTLCTDVQRLVVDHLPLVDRVCLGLTCKSMTRLVLLATKLCPVEESQAVGVSVNHLNSFVLLQRLAYGWIPRQRFRFCSWCCKIYTRSPEYWLKREMLKKPLRWSSRIPIPKYQWMLMSRNAKYECLILRWRDAPSDDASPASSYPCAVPPGERLWYEMIHCPECTANTLALAPPGLPRGARPPSPIERCFIQFVEAAYYFPTNMAELVRSGVSSLSRLLTRQLRWGGKQGTYILPKWYSR